MLRRLLVFLLATGTLFGGSSSYVRFVENAQGAQLVTSVLSFENEDGVKVDLVSAVHIADRSYYVKQNQLFTSYDALLFELIGDVRHLSQARRTPSNLGRFQRFLKDFLELDFQLDVINYQRANFVHADMNYQTYIRMTRARGENFLTLMLNSMRYQMMNGSQGQVTFFDLLNIMTSDDQAREWKIILARQMSNIDSMAKSLEGPGGTSVIISERNKVAIKVLKKQIAQGVTRLGIYYGAAHMPDLEQRLKKMKFKRTGIKWLIAWNMPAVVNKVED